MSSSLFSQTFACWQTVSSSDMLWHVVLYWFFPILLTICVISRYSTTLRLVLLLVLWPQECLIVQDCGCWTICSMKTVFLKQLLTFFVKLKKTKGASTPNTLGSVQTNPNFGLFGLVWKLLWFFTMLSKVRLPLHPPEQSDSQKQLQQCAELVSSWCAVAVH